MKTHPENPKFLGHVIANDNEEFLHEFYLTPFSSLLVWSRAIDFVHIFETRKKAEKIIKQFPKHNRLWNLDLFENDHKFFLSTTSRVRPKWLS